MVSRMVNICETPITNFLLSPTRSWFAIDPICARFEKESLTTIVMGNPVSFNAEKSETVQAYILADAVEDPERKNAAYSEENIERAIAGNLTEIEAGTRPAFIPRPKPQPYRPHPKYKGFLALYYHYCYLLGRIEKRQYLPRMTPHLRQEIMKAETYKARLKFLQENGIATADDLTAYMQQAESKAAQLAKQRTILNVRKKKRKKLFDALAAEEALSMSKALYEEGLSGMESEYAQYAEAKALLDSCGISRQDLTAEKADIYEQLAQLNKQIRAERQKIKLCREIADSAAVMQRDVAAQEKSPYEKETEHFLTNRR